MAGPVQGSWVGHFGKGSDLRPALPQNGASLLTCRRDWVVFGRNEITTGLGCGPGQARDNFFDPFQ